MNRFAKPLPVSHLLLIVAGVISLGGLTAGAQERAESRGGPISIPAGVVFEKDIAYRQGNPKWRLDLAYPIMDGEAMRPALVVVHGGGWRSGDKAGGQWTRLPLQYAQKGYVAISVNYRLSGEAPFPACVEDVKCAVRWLRAHAERYQVDPERIAAYGNSAGAHLVSMLGVAGSDAGLEGDGPWKGFSSEVQAVCASAAPTDFTEWRGRPFPGDNPLFKGPAETLGDRRRLASPVYHVSEAVPPFLLIHGTADRTVPLAQGQRLAEALKAIGVKVDWLTFDGAGHGVFQQHQKETYPAMEAFFADALGLRRRSESAKKRRHSLARVTPQSEKGGLGNPSQKGSYTQFL